MKSGITVSASGQAFVVPDQAIINLAASVVLGDAATAMTDVSRRVERLLSNLRDAGIEEHHIQTTDLSLWPETDRNGTPVGYRARNGVRISLADVSRTGEVVAVGLAALGEGAEMDGVTFRRREVDSAEAEARAIAWQGARAKASQLADHAGLTLGRPLSIKESEDRGFEHIDLMSRSMPVVGGSTTVTVILTVRFALLG
jgi:uncharacterized protein YggE